MMRVSISKIKTFKSCRRAYELKYLEHLRPVQKAEALQIGSNYHALLEELNNQGHHWNYEEFTKERAMAEAYYKYIFPHFNVLAAEKELTFDLGNGDSMIGYADGIADDGCIVEHKTTGFEITEQYEYNLLWDEQILAYMLMTGMRKVHYTVCRKPTIRLKKDETEEEFFNRMVEWYDTDTDSKIRLIEIERSDEEVERFHDDLLLIVEEMRHAGYFYKNTCHCNMYGRRCEYSSICMNYDPNMDYIDFVKEEEEEENGNSDDKF